MKRISLTLVLPLLLAACTASTPLAPTAPPVLRKFKLPMGFIASVQYANFYVAVEKGYFAAEGMEIEFDYSFETNGVQLVGANERPFAVVSGEQVLLARAQGLPVKYVMAWFQKFPVAVVSKAEAGLKTPADLRGKTIGVPTLDGANFIGLHALLAAEGIPAAEVNIEAIGFNQVEALNAGRVDAAVVYSNNEPIRLAAQGQTLNVIQVSDYATLAANGILSNEDTLAKDPALVRSFVRALIKGTQAVIDNPDEAYTITKKFVPELKDDAVEKQVLAATIELWKANKLGEADAQAWQNMNATLLEAALLTTPLDVNQAFTNEFLP